MSLTPRQKTVYILLTQLFRQCEIKPSDAIPAMRQLTNDAEDFLKNHNPILSNQPTILQ